MTAVDLISLLASVASLVLAVVAIWLSIVFFKLSSKLSESTQEAAKGIGASVERLEKLFDKLYADTFSMMRDTVSDMRKHIWPEDTSEADRLAEEAEKKADTKMAELRKTVTAELAQVLDRQRMTDERVKSVRSEVGHLIERAMLGSRHVELEAREETLRENVLRQIRLLSRRKPKVTASDLLERLGGEATASAMVAELERLRAEGLLILSDPAVGPATEISFTAPGRPHVAHRAEPAG